MKRFIILAAFFIGCRLQGQSLYFPPVSDTTWATINPTSLGWCQPRIDSLYNFLETRNTNGFIILKDGKIVLEKYFGSFTRDSVNKWASASKSLTSMLTGIAQEQGVLTIHDTVSNIIGNGWTSCTTSQERQITILNLLTMTSGLNDNPTGSCNNEDVTAACLQYLVPPGTRWAYHTGAYRKLEDVIATAAGVSYNSFTKTRIANAIGMAGSWVNYMYYSRVRDAARFGLLALNKGVWGTDTLLHDTAYYTAMTNTSQNFNLSYGYLWWLNGKPSYMAPGSQTVFTAPFFSNAPTDMIAALGKDDQKIYVVPSQDMVVVRLGNSAYGVAAAFSPFDNELWGYIDSLSCAATPAATINPDKMLVYPNPVSTLCRVELPAGTHHIIVWNIMGQKMYEQNTNETVLQIDCTAFATGVYFIQSEGGVLRLYRQ